MDRRLDSLHATVQRWYRYREYLLQLESRTWAAIQSWMRMCITAHWFDIQVKGIYSRMSPENWKCVVQTCKPENAQAFAGQHARTSTSWYLFDESSHIPDAIWDVAMGGLTDGEPMFFCLGQPARKSGRFYEICLGKLRDRWNVRSIDSRTSRFTNKALIDEWIRDYGEDIDFCRVPIKGIAPRAGDLQFIDQDRIDGRQQDRQKQGCGNPGRAERENPWMDLGKQARVGRLSFHYQDRYADEPAEFSEPASAARCETRQDRYARRGLSDAPSKDAKSVQLQMGHEEPECR